MANSPRPAAFWVISPRMQRLIEGWRARRLAPMRQAYRHRQIARRRRG